MIALITATQPELELVRKAACPLSVERWNDRDFFSGEICGRPVVAVSTGVGKVLAAAVTQRLIDKYSPEAVIMSGIGGSINPSIKRGDIVIGIDCIQHDFDATRFGFKRGEIPYTGHRIITSDARLVETALSWDRSVRKGRILTGDQFITGAGSPGLAYLRDELNGDIVEMEGAAVGLTAKINDVPFLLVRAVSDNADGEAGGYKRFLKTSSERLFELIRYILENY